MLALNEITFSFWVLAYFGEQKITLDAKSD
jgi:hypothetical protein